MDLILSGTHPLMKNEVIQFAGLLAQSLYGSHTESLGKKYLMWAGKFFNVLESYNTQTVISLTRTYENAHIRVRTYP